MELADLEAVLLDRKSRPPAGSYSATLLTDAERASRKLMEEAYEVCLELTRPHVDQDRAAAEAADLLFHLLAGLVGAGVPLERVMAELGARRGAGSGGPVAQPEGSQDPVGSQDPAVEQQEESQP